MIFLCGSFWSGETWGSVRFTEPSSDRRSDSRP
jgi:hypothetical protein